MHPSLVSPAVVTPSAMMVSTTSLGGPHLSSTPPGPSSSTLNLLRSILPREIFSSLKFSDEEVFMFLIDTDGRLSPLSGNSFLGICSTEIEGLPVYTLLHPDDHGRFRTTQQEVEKAVLSMPGQLLAASKVLNCRIRELQAMKCQEAHGTPSCLFQHMQNGLEDFYSCLRFSSLMKLV